MKKNNEATKKDKKDWVDFTKNIKNIAPKEIDQTRQNINSNIVKKLDLHGYSLTEANQKVKKFITNSFNEGYKKILIVTGKGKHSEAYNDPYRSSKLSIIKYSVPDFIKGDKNLIDKVKKISEANIKDGGEGALYIFLKNKFR